MKKVKGKYAWSKADIEKLETLFPVTSNKSLANMFGIGWRTVVRKARELGLEKHPDFRVLIDFQELGKKGSEHQNTFATRIKKGDHKSSETQFKPGHVPWHKGKTLLEKLKYKASKKYSKLNY